MCMFWNHKWETLERHETNIVDEHGNTLTTKYILIQRCTHCGKEIVRKYRV